MPSIQGSLTSSHSPGVSDFPLKRALSGYGPLAQHVYVVREKNKRIRRELCKCEVLLYIQINKGLQQINECIEVETVSLGVVVRFSLDF